MRSESVQGVRYYADKGKVLKITKGGVLRGFFDSFPVLVGSGYVVEEMTQQQMDDFVNDNKIILGIGASYF